MWLLNQIDLLVLWAGHDYLLTLGINLLPKQDWVLPHSHDS